MGEFERALHLGGSSGTLASGLVERFPMAISLAEARMRRVAAMMTAVAPRPHRGIHRARRLLIPQRRHGLAAAADDTAGLLAWPAADQLYLVDGQGQVQHSGDGGRQWQPTGSIGGQPAAFIADESGLYAALADSTVKRSTDGGATWTVRATP
jgi:hypothetical protein